MRYPILCMAAAAAAFALPQPVKTKAGPVAGVPGTDGSVLALKGIPFAAPPVGDLRWRAPQPAPSWEGVRQAVRFGSSCVQRGVPERKPWTYEFMTHNEIGEDA
jgi:para-nitrobenzyl esterase